MHVLIIWIYILGVFRKYYGWAIQWDWWEICRFPFPWMVFIELEIRYRYVQFCSNIWEFAWNSVLYWNVRVCDSDKPSSSLSYSSLLFHNSQLALRQYGIQSIVTAFMCVYSEISTENDEYATAMELRCMRICLLESNRSRN